jgi:prepilin-type processing-associated H-X9-DG protein
VKLSQHIIRAFNLIELVVVVATVGIFLVILLYYYPRVTSSAIHVACLNDLKQIGLYYRTWASDHSGRFPMQVSVTNGGTLELIQSPSVFPHFQIMSNEIQTAKVLLCPADKARNPATNFTTDFHNENLSYFVGIDATKTNQQMLLAGDRNITDTSQEKHGVISFPTNTRVKWTSKIHKNRGNLLFADGHAEQTITATQLNSLFQNTGVATNRLAIP